MFRQAAVTALLLAAVACGGTVDVEEERAAIRDVWNRANRALESGDWESYSALWAHADYIQLVHPGGPEWLSGWDEVGPEYRKRVGEGPSHTVRTRDMQIRVAPSGDMAWATMKWEVSVGDGGDSTRVSYWGTSVFEKIDGEWKIVHGIATQPARRQE